jgi:hypothetical protein
MKYLVYYKTKEDNVRVLYNDGVIDELDYLPTPDQYNTFHLFKGYDTSDEGLRSFKADFDRWSEELLTNDIMSIDYRKYYTHYSAVELTFKRLCKGKYEHHEPIDALESSWIESTHNGGLTYCNAGEHQSYGYDFSSFYPCIMSKYHLTLPHKKGAEHFLKVLPSKIELGFYRVRITSEHKDVKKVFAFSKEQVYNNVSLQHAIDLQEEFNMQIELIIDDKPNAYLYPKGVRVSSVFGVWCDRLYKIKMMYPKNKLIKHLLSSLWGSLSRGNNIIRTFKQIQDENLKVSMDGSDGSDYKILDYTLTSDKEYYKLQSLLNPYKYNLRLKSFITAYGRMQISEVARENIAGVLRIQTDGIVFDRPMKLDYPLLVADAKTTGLIKWNHCNKYDEVVGDADSD